MTLPASLARAPEIIENRYLMTNEVQFIGDTKHIM